MSFQIVEGMTPPIVSETRSQMLALVELAQQMEVGQAAILTNSQAQQFRLILAGMGFNCVTDGWRCEVRGKTLAFKMAKIPHVDTPPTS